MALKIGSTAPRETHDSQEVERLRKGRLTTVRLNGDYSQLKGMQPAPGEKRDGGRVQTSTLRRLQGGIGLLEYTVKAGSGGSGSGSISEDEVEIEMAQTERPILSLKKFQGYADVVERWRNAPDDLRLSFKYGDGADEKLTGRGLEAAKLILRGIESVLVFHPVATLTTEHDTRPALYGRDIGKRVRPSISGAPAGFDWLKTADRLHRATDGTWTRVQQWTGASEDLGGWEKTLYGD